MTFEDRIRNYVRQRTGRRSLDPDVIHALDTGCDTEAELTLSDLNAMLDEIEALRKRAADRDYLKQLYDAEGYHRETVGMMYQRLALAMQVIMAGASTTPNGKAALAALQAAEKLKGDRAEKAPKVMHARSSMAVEEQQ